MTWHPRYPAQAIARQHQLQLGADAGHHRGQALWASRVGPEGMQKSAAALRALADATEAAAKALQEDFDLPPHGYGTRRRS